MFEDMSISFVQVLIAMFWIGIISIIIWGALWLHSLQHVREEK